LKSGLTPLRVVDSALERALRHEFALARMAVRAEIQWKYEELDLFMDELSVLPRGGEVQMLLSSPNSFEVGNEEYRFEIEPPRYSYRPFRWVDPEFERLEDRFHRTVKITRLRDSRSWTGAVDIRPQYMNDLTEYFQLWLENCFAQWKLEAIPNGFDIPQTVVPREPAEHHCPEFPIVSARRKPRTDDNAGSDIVDTASEASFPASDPPAWIGTRIA